MSLTLSSGDTARLSAAVERLLSPEACSDAILWRAGAGRAIRDLMGADSACVALDDDPASFVAVDLDDSVIRAYRERYAAVDHGIARMRAQRIEVWERRKLWRSSELARSEYYNDFALPHRLLDAAGITSFSGGQCLRVCVMYAQPPRTARGEAAWQHQLELLRLAWPAFNAGSILSARSRAWQASVSQMIDRVGHPLVLCTATGALVHENAAFAELITANRCAEIPELVRAAAREVAASAARRRPCDSVVRDLSLPSGSHRLVGWSVDLELGGPAMVLVSMVPGETDSLVGEALRARHEELRTRFGFTRRQLQVLELLRQRRSNAEIAEALRISEHTARHHTEMVLSKLGVHSRRLIAAQGGPLGSNAAPEAR